MSEKINAYELLYLARGSNDYAFEMLIEQFKPLFYKTFKELKQYSENLDYDEQYEAMIMGLLNAVAHYREDKNAAFSTFINLCITREMKNNYRKSFRKSFGFTAVSLDSYTGDDNVNYGEVLLRDDSNDPAAVVRYNLLLESIEQTLVKENDSKIFHMRLDGYSYNEIARALGIKPKDVDNSLQRIRKKIAYLFD